MNIVEVIPFSRGINKDLLSYFAPADVKEGAIVKAPLRGRSVSALVVSSRAVEDLKQEVKNSAFSYKKATLVSQNILSSHYLAAAKRAAEFHVSTLGSLIYSLLPKIFLECMDKLETVAPPEKTPAELHGAILQAEDTERFAHYRSLVREEFAKGRSVFLCMPTAGDIKRAEKLLEKGMAEYSYFFHSTGKKKDFVKKWNDLIKEKHPVFIVATGQFLCLPRHDIGTIIIEREHSRSYKSLSRPFTDIRTFAEIFAKETGARMVLSDTLLRAETVWRYRNDELGEITPPSLKVQTTAIQKVVDNRRSLKSSDRFDPISSALEELIKNSKEKNERLFIFASRRGLAPLTVCADCGTVVTCRRCQAPVVLHVKGDDRFFMCHRCGDKREAAEKCLNCTSWKLKTLGIGAELIHEEIKKRFPNHKVWRLDSDSAKTHSQATKITEEFYESPGGILVGTEMALLYLDKKVENVAIASIDSMFSMPDFRIREKILSILMRLRSISQKNFIIQTRYVGEPVFDFASTGNLLDFYKQEISERQKFDYPPFTVLIKVSLSGSKASVESEMNKLADNLKDYEIGLYPAFTPYTKGNYTMHALIKIGRSRWVEKSLYEKLRALPPSFSIAVDPDSIL